MFVEIMQTLSVSILNHNTQPQWLCGGLFNVFFSSSKNSLIICRVFFSTREVFLLQSDCTLQNQLTQKDPILFEVRILNWPIGSRHKILHNSNFHMLSADDSADDFADTQSKIHVDGVQSSDLFQSLIESRFTIIWPILRHSSGIYEQLN